MIDKDHPPSPQTLPPFTPVPRHTSRHDGWTPERQRGFIEALADTGSVKRAAHAVNMTPEGAYQLRRHAQAGEFRAAWDAALALGVQRLEDIAMDRALHGVEVPVYHFGAVVGTRRVYNDRLLMFLLRNRAPERFRADARATGADRLNAVQLARLKAQWQAEYEAERNTPQAVAAIHASVLRKVEAMRQTMLADFAREQAAPAKAEAAAKAEAPARTGADAPLRTEAEAPDAETRKNS